MSGNLRGLKARGGFRGYLLQSAGAYFAPSFLRNLSMREYLLECRPDEAASVARIPRPGRVPGAALPRFEHRYGFLVAAR